jgi:hypothetical protein
LHAALQFKKGEREIARKISRGTSSSGAGRYVSVLLLFVAFFRKTQKFRGPTGAGCASIFRRRKSGRVSIDQFAEPLSREHRAGRALHRFLDTLNAMRRLDEIRAFRSLDYGAKKAGAGVSRKKIAGLLEWLDDRCEPRLQAGRHRLSLPVFDTHFFRANSISNL